MSPETYDSPKEPEDTKGYPHKIYLIAIHDHVNFGIRSKLGTKYCQNQLAELASKLLLNYNYWERPGGKALIVEFGQRYTSNFYQISIQDIKGVSTIRIAMGIVEYTKYMVRKVVDDLDELPEIPKKIITNLLSIVRFGNLLEE